MTPEQQRARLEALAQALTELGILQLGPTNSHVHKRESVLVMCEATTEDGGILHFDSNYYECDCDAYTLAVGDDGATHVVGGRLPSSAPEALRDRDVIVIP